MVKQAAKTYNAVELEKRIRQHWTEINAYKQTRDQREHKGLDYYFIDGPPYTTDNIHIGTALNKTVKDLYIRYLRMRGYNVRDQPGFDMHGLPIEVMVEQALRIKDKTEIEKIGIDKFVNACRDYAIDFQKKMTESFKQLGVWMDWDNPYLTITSNYIQAAWWTIKKAHEKGLLKEDFSVLSWCPRCQTVLAESEIEYWDESDPSIYVMFPIKNETNVYLLIWTTTPWTLPANLAIAAHPDFEYSYVEITKGDKDFTVVILSEKVDDMISIIQPETYRVKSKAKGDSLEGIRYHPVLFDDVTLQKTVKAEWVHRVVLSRFVTAENTGLVHIAPGHGREDFEIGQDYKLPIICPIDDHGIYTADAGNFQGMGIKEANPIIINALEDKGYMFHSDRIGHRYGHCWRCKTSIIYRPTRQWFLRVSQLKDRMLDEIDNIKWVPEWVGSGRMKEWVQNARDWCISRQRYWGIPLPVWKCNCGTIQVISSTTDLKGAENYKDGMDLHRPWIDSVKLKCPACGKLMDRVPDVLDVWFDSGVCSWAQLGYPGDDTEFKRWFPCKWITEAYEQTRGWYYSQLGAGIITMDKCPYQSVLSHGLIIDEKGQKMSKSSGNSTKPNEIIEKMGADTLRFYLLKSGPIWEDLMFSKEGVKNTGRTLNVLWNVYVFATTYMSLDEYDSKTVTFEELSGVLKIEDKWLLSVIESLKKKVTDYLKEYQIHKACRELEYFILEDLSRWYIKLIRDRIWVEGESKDKTAAYYSLHQALVTIAQLMAPITPHLSEELYSNIEGYQPTVHMCEWPMVNENLIDTNLENNMLILRNTLEALNNARQQAGIKLRWPLKRAVVVANNEDIANSLNSLKPLFVSLANVKVFKIYSPNEKWEELDLEAQPNTEAIGQQYRQWATKIGALLKMQPPREIKAGIDKGEFTVGIEGQLIKIFPNMISFVYKPPKTMKTCDFEGGRVYIDLETSPELKAESYAREVVRRIQEMRKELDLNVEEYIDTVIAGDDNLKKHLSTWIDFISKETRSHKLQFRDVPVGDCIIEWGIGEYSVVIGVANLHMKDAVKEFIKLDIDGLKSEQAKLLFFGGFMNLAKLKSATVDEIAKVRGLNRELAENIYDYFRAPPKAELSVPAPSPTSISASGQSSTLPGQERLPEQPLPPPPQDTPKPKTLDMKKSYIYMIKGIHTDPAYGYFRDEILKGTAGMCITRSYPDRVREKFSLKDVPIVWLTNAPKENAMRPKDLEKLSLSIEHFLKSKTEGSIVMLDCIEYLITNNTFSVVLRFIQSLRDMIAINRAILLITANPATFEPQQLNLVEREVDVSI